MVKAELVAYFVGCESPNQVHFACIAPRRPITTLCTVPVIVAHDSIATPDHFRSGLLNEKCTAVYEGVAAVAKQNCKSEKSAEKPVPMTSASLIVNLKQEHR
jgi:hypothetical protein